MPPERGSLRAAPQPRHLWKVSTGPHPQQILDRRRRSLLAVLPSTHALRQRSQPRSGSLIRPIEDRGTPRSVAEDPTLRQKGKKKSRLESSGVDRIAERNLAVRMLREVMTKTSTVCHHDLPGIEKIRHKLDVLRSKHGLDRDFNDTDWERVWSHIAWRVGRRQRRELRSRRRLEETRAPLLDVTSNFETPSGQEDAGSRVQSGESEGCVQRQTLRGGAVQVDVPHRNHLAAASSESGVSLSRSRRATD